MSISECKPFQIGFCIYSCVVVDKISIYIGSLRQLRFLIYKSENGVIDDVLYAQRAPELSPRTIRPIVLFNS